MIDYYSDNMMYSNLYDDEDSNIRYRETVRSVGATAFQTCTVYISNDVKDNNPRTHRA